MSFSLHSSTVNFGGGRRSSSNGSNSNSRLSRLGEVLDRRDVAEGVGETFLDEPLERAALDRDEVRKFEDLVEVRERVTVADGGAGGQGATPRMHRGGRASPTSGRALSPELNSGENERQGTATGQDNRRGPRDGKAQQNRPLRRRSVPRPCVSGSVRKVAHGVKHPRDRARRCEGRSGGSREGRTAGSGSGEVLDPAGAEPHEGPGRTDPLVDPAPLTRGGRRPSPGGTGRAPGPRSGRARRGRSRGAPGRDG